MVRDGETGLLVPVGDARALGAAIVRGVRDRALRANLGFNAQRMVTERFTADTMTQGNLAVYEDLIR